MGLGGGAWGMDGACVLLVHGIPWPAGAARPSLLREVLSVFLLQGVSSVHVSSKAASVSVFAWHWAPAA